MPCSAKMSLAAFRISAWGVGEAASFRVVPARSVVSSEAASLVEAASLSAGAVLSAAEEEAEEPQAARLRARVPARATEISFFIVGVSFSCVFSCVNVLVPAVMSLNKYSGTFAHRAVCRSQSYKFLPRFYQSGKGGRLPQEKSRAPNRFGALLHATLMRQILRTGKQAQTAEASCTCTSS